MIGARFIGGQWLGFGRANLPDYIEVSASFGAAAGAGVDTLRAGSPVSGNFDLSVAFSAGQPKRLRGMSVDMPAGASMGALASRERKLSASLAGSASLSALVGRERLLSSSFRASAGLSEALLFRARKLSATMTASADLAPLRLRRQRFMSGSFGASTGFSPAMARGRFVAAGFSVSMEMAAGDMRSYFEPGQVGRWIYVVPKDRAVYVPPKDRAIVFTGDDQELFMDIKVKQPAEVVDYTLDMREWFRSIRSDFIVNVETTIEPAGELELGPGTLPTWVPAGLTPHQAKIWIGSGQDGESYRVTNIVTTDRGRVEKVEFTLRVERQ